jgi:hypothetical protein
VNDSNCRVGKGAPRAVPTMIKRTRFRRKMVGTPSGRAFARLAGFALRLRYVQGSDRVFAA